MRPIELAVCIAGLPLLVACLLRFTFPSWCRLLPAVALLLTIFQIWIEEPRWQMVPAYLVIFWLLFAYAWPGGGSHHPGRWVPICGMGFIASSVMLCVLLPVFELPMPTGINPIGTVTHHWIDPTRQEPRSDKPDGHRELMVQIWYPAEQSGRGKRYRTLSETSIKTQQLALVRTHASLGAHLATGQEKYPVVIFTPGIKGRRNHNTVQAEELASHGFLVVGIDHPYSSEVVIFPDGRKVQSAINHFSPTDLTPNQVELSIRVADVHFVLDQLESLNGNDSENIFTNRIDLTRIGILGHSFGGAVASEVCLTEPRAKAGINLDGFIYGKSLSDGFGKPFLFLCDDGPIPTSAEVDAATGANKEWLKFVHDNCGSIKRGLSDIHGYWATIKGAKHWDFCDSPLYCPIKLISGAGPISYDRATQVINAYIVSFFTKHLKGVDNHLLDNPSDIFPEVEFEKF
jgi:dienelactone hydrolase